MTKTELNLFRQALAGRRAELEQGIKNRDALVIETSADELDRIQHASDRDYALQHLARNSARLREIRAALGRIRVRYVRNLRRLRGRYQAEAACSVPWAALCIVCQETADREEKTVHGEFDTSLLMAA